MRVLAFDGGPDDALQRGQGPPAPGEQDPLGSDLEAMHDGGGGDPGWMRLSRKLGEVSRTASASGWASMPWRIMSVSSSEKYAVIAEAPCGASSMARPRPSWAAAAFDMA